MSNGDKISTSDCMSAGDYMSMRNIARITFISTDDSICMGSPMSASRLMFMSSPARLSHIHAVCVRENPTYKM